jgi:hypothetical protein
LSRSREDGRQAPVLATFRDAVMTLSMSLPAVSAFCILPSTLAPGWRWAHFCFLLSAFCFGSMVALVSL